MTKINKTMLMIILFILFASISTGIVLADDIPSIQIIESSLNFVDFITTGDEINSIAIDSEGSIYLTFEDKSYIKKYDKSRQLVDTWPNIDATPSNKYGEFNKPRGLVVGNEDGIDYIYVADTGNKRIQKLTTGGAFEAEYTQTKDDPEELYAPYDVTLDSDNNLYALFPGASYDDKAIVKLVDIQDGKCVWEEVEGLGLGSPPSYESPASLSNDASIIVTSSGEIYVVNSRTIYKHNSFGIGEDDLHYCFDAVDTIANGSVNGITLDDEDNIYYTDYSNLYKKSVDNQITKYKGLSSASDIAVDNEDNFYVVSGNKVMLLDTVAPVINFTFNESVGNTDDYHVDIDFKDYDPASGKPEVCVFQYVCSTSSDPVTFNSAKNFKLDEGVDTTSFGITSSGTYYLHVKVKDKAGNETIKVSEGFQIDRDGPIVTLTPNGGPNPRPDYEVDISLSDESEIDIGSLKYSCCEYDYKPNPDSSDVEEVKRWIKWPNTTETSIDVKLSEIGVLDNGEYWLWFYGEDKFGNETYLNSEIFSIDKNIKPITITTAGFSANMDNDSDYNQDYNIDVDTLSGDDVNIYYQWTDTINQPDENSGDWIETDSENINYGENYSGTKYFHVKSVVDGNIYYDSRELLFDNEAPEITLSPNSSTTPKNNVSTEVQIQNNINGQVSKYYTKWILKSELNGNENDWNNNIKFTEDDVTTESAIVLDSIDGRYILFVKAMDIVGNEKVTHSDEFVLDNTPPTGSVNIENTTVTTSAVTINLNVNDNISSSDNLRYIYSIDNGESWNEQWIQVSDGLDITLTSNESNQDMSVKVKYKDEAENISEIYSVTKTIAFNPEGAITWIEYSTTDWTNQNVVAKLNNNGDIEILNNEASNEYTFEENGVFYFKINDLANNSIRNVKAQVYNIDKEVLVPEIIKSTTLPTNENVKVLLETREKINILNNHEYGFVDLDNDGSYECEFADNGIYILNLEDKLGNTTSVAIEIDNIDKTPPILSCSKSTIETTTESVKVEITADEPISILNNLGSSRKTFDENGSFTFKAEDYAGNTSEITITVDNIDREPPKVWIEYSNEDATKGSVIATIRSEEKFTVLNNDGSTEYTFNENGRFYFKVSDDAGNEKMAETYVTNIDKTKPRIYFNGEDHIVIIKNGNEDALADYVAYDNNDGIVTDKVILDKSGYNISVEGTYEIKYTVSDEAGNECEVKRKVTVISSDQLKIYVNGIDSDQDKPIIIDDKYINLNILNNQGSYKIKWKKGEFLQGKMKQNSNIADGQAFHVDDKGWYTIYFQDQERITKLIKIYAY